MLFTKREVRTGKKTVAEVLRTARAEGRRPYSRLRAQFFPYESPAR